MKIEQFLGNFLKIDYKLFIAIILLVGFGLAAIYSVALGQGKNEFLNFQKQIIWLFVGLGFMFTLANIDYHFWKKFGFIGFLLALLLLILVVTPLGLNIRGTSGWFNLGFFAFQPVEMAKIFLIMVLANIYSRYARIIADFKHLFAIGFMVLIPIALVLLQPDFGSAMVLFAIWFFSFFLVTKNKWHFIFIVSAIVGVFFLGWFFVFQDFQKARIATFFNPELDPQGRGYNVKQSIIAVGAGRLVGRGLGFGSQSQLKFIPESQTDFIFAVIAEEMGFVGVLLLLSLFGFIFYRLFIIARKAPDDFGMYLVLLFIILIFIHVFINIGMGIG
ncbi:MAG: FtsW/RodA/SpoVE family cell cycle protein, partial [bacterium]